jgi:hypothetical protein
MENPAGINKVYCVIPAFQKFFLPHRTIPLRQKP